MSILNIFKQKPKSKPVISQGELSKILNNIKNHKSYYAGGSLCVDNVLKDDVLVINLDGTCHAFVNVNKLSESVICSFDNRNMIFQIYRETKGITEHYTDEMIKYNV